MPTPTASDDHAGRSPARLDAPGDEAQARERRQRGDDAEGGRRPAVGQHERDGANRDSRPRCPQPDRGAPAVERREDTGHQSGRDEHRRRHRQRERVRAERERPPEEGDGAGEQHEAGDADRAGQELERERHRRSLRRRLREVGAAVTTFAGTENPTPIARRSCETLRRGSNERGAEAAMAFEELKQRHAAMWGAGPFEVIAPTLAEMHEAIVAAADADGRRLARRGLRHGRARVPRRGATGASVRGCDLVPGARRDGEATGGRAWPRDPVRGRRRRGLPYDDGELRRRLVVRRRDLRSRPRAHRRGAGPRLRIRRPARADGVDDRGPDRRLLPRSSARTRRRRSKVRERRRRGATPRTARRFSARHFELRDRVSQHAVGGRVGPGEMWDEIRLVVRADRDAARRCSSPSGRAAFRDDLVALFDESAERTARCVLDRPYLLVKGTRR